MGGLALLGGLVAVVVVAVNAFSTGIRPAQEAASAYATALVDQRWDDAHALLCEESADQYGPDDLATLYGDPPVVGFSLDGVNVQWSNGRTTGDVGVTLELEGGLRQRTALPLVRDGEDWLVCP